MSEVESMAERKLKINYRKSLIFLGSGIIIFLSLANIILWTKNEIAKQKRMPIKNEIAYWENLIQETPTYRDGYLKLATLYWQLEDKEKVKENLDKAIEVDPNYEETKRLRKQLGY